MAEELKHPNRNRWHRIAGVLAGSAVFALANAGVTYEDYQTDVTRNHDAQLHGDAYFKGYMQATLDSEKNHLEWEGSLGGMLAAAALFAVGVGTGKKRV
jgi:hypothetical protein